jgi:hypothetical protein
MDCFLYRRRSGEEVSRKQFTASRESRSDGERLFTRPMVVLLTLRADCSLLALKMLRLHLIYHRGGNLGEYSNANTGVRSPCSKFHPNFLWMKLRPNFQNFTYFWQYIIFNTKSAIHISIICIEVPALKAAGAS